MIVFYPEKLISKNKNYIDRYILAKKKAPNLVKIVKYCISNCFYLDLIKKMAPLIKSDRRQNSLIDVKIHRRHN